MEEIAKSDIFFFVSTIAVVVVTIFTAIILYYIVKLAKKASEIAEKLSAEVDNFKEGRKNFVYKAKVWQKWIPIFISYILFKRRRP